MSLFEHQRFFYLIYLTLLINYLSSGITNSSYWFSFSLTYVNVISICCTWLFDQAFIKTKWLHYRFPKPKESSGDSWDAPSSSPRGHGFGFQNPLVVLTPSSGFWPPSCTHSPSFDTEDRPIMWQTPLCLSPHPPNRLWWDRTGPWWNGILHHMFDPVSKY